MIKKNLEDLVDLDKMVKEEWPRHCPSFLNLTIFGAFVIVVSSSSISPIVLSVATRWTRLLCFRQELLLI
jgi:hypothetical protein